MPLLTRFFSPEDFGLFAVFMVFVQLFSISMTLRLEMAVLLPKKDTDAALLCVMSFVFLLLSILIVCFLIWLFVLSFKLDWRLFVDEYVNYQQSLPEILLYLFPLAVLFLGSYNIALS